MDDPSLQHKKLLIQDFIFKTLKKFKYAFLLGMAHSHLSIINTYNHSTDVSEGLFYLII